MKLEHLKYHYPRDLIISWKIENLSLEETNHILKDGISFITSTSEGIKVIGDTGVSKVSEKLLMDLYIEFVGFSKHRRKLGRVYTLPSGILKYVFKKEGVLVKYQCHTIPLENIEDVINGEL